MAMLLLPLLATAAAGAPAPNAMDVFTRLAGKCWQGTVAEGAENLHCFDPVYDGAHVRDRHRVIVGERVVYEGETLYSRRGGHVLFTYWNSLGGIGQGTGTTDADGICFEGEMRRDPDAAAQPVSLCWRWTEDGYVVLSSTDDPVRFHPTDRRF